LYSGKRRGKAVALMNKHEVFGDKRAVIYNRQTVTGEAAPHWHLKVKLPKRKAVRISLKTTDFEEAKQLARVEYFKLEERADKNLSLEYKIEYFRAFAMFHRFVGDNKRKISETANRSRLYSMRRYFFHPSTSIRDDGDIIRDKRKTAKNGRVWSDSGIEHPFDMDRHINTLTVKDWENFLIEAERAYRVIRGKDMKQSTVNHLIKVIGLFYDWAIREAGYLTEADRVWVKLRKVDWKKQRRPALTEDDLLHLYKVAEQRISAATRGYVIYSRTAIYYLLRIANQCGGRPTDFMMAKWADIKKEDGEIYIFMQGKKHSGYAYIAEGGVKYLNKLRELQIEFAQKVGWVWSEDTYIMTKYNGERWRSPFRSMRELLRAAGLHEVTEDGVLKTRSLYSQRHTYATMRLKYAENISIHELGVQMRTGTKYIEQVYSKLKAEDIKDKLKSGTHQETELSSDKKMESIEKLLELPPEKLNALLEIIG